MAESRINVEITGNDQLSAKLDGLTARLNKLEGTVRRNTKRLDIMGRKLRGAGGQAQNLGRKAREAGQGIFGLSNKLKQLADKAGIASVVSDKLISTIARFASVTIIIGFVVRAFQRLSDAIQKAFRNAAEFDKAFAEVRTIMGATVPQTKQIRKALQDISKEVIQSPTDLAKGFYQVLSAGVTNTSDALKVLKVSANTATAGITDTFTAVDAITTILNAFGKSADEAGQISDVLFNTVKEGKLVFADLANNIGKVAPFAAQTGVSLEETLSALAALTKAGLNTELATTALKSAFISVLNPSKEAADLARSLGIEWSVSSLKAKGLIGFLAEVQEKTHGNTEAITQLFGNARAMTAALSLAGQQMNEFARINATMATAAGSTNTAVQEVNDTLEAQWELFKSKLGPTINEIADDIRNPLKNAFDALNLSLENTNTLFGEAIKNIEKDAPFLATVARFLSNLATETLRQGGGPGSGGITKYIKALADDEKAIRDALEGRQQAKDLLSAFLAPQKKQTTIASLGPFVPGTLGPAIGTFQKKAAEQALLKSTLGDVETKKLLNDTTTRQLNNALINQLQLSVKTPPSPFGKLRPKKEQLAVLESARGLSTTAPALKGRQEREQARGLDFEARDRQARFQELANNLQITNDAFLVMSDAGALFADQLSQGTFKLREFGEALTATVRSIGSQLITRSLDSVLKPARDSIQKTLVGSIVEDKNGLKRQVGGLVSPLLGSLATGGLFIGASALLGSLFGGKKEHREEQNAQNLEKIARNTEENNKLFDQIINAPEKFILPNVSQPSYAGVSRQTFRDLSR